MSEEKNIEEIPQDETTVNPDGVNNETMQKA